MPKKAQAVPSTTLQKDIQQEIIELEQIYASIDTANKAMQIEIDSLMSPILRKKIAQVKERYGKSVDSLINQVALKENLIRSETLRFGHTVRGNFITALYQNGKLVWDGKALMAYGNTVNYEVLKFRKQGKPNVRIAHHK
jgi:hypothetical protein